MRLHDHSPRKVTYLFNSCDWDTRGERYWQGQYPHNLNPEACLSWGLESENYLRGISEGLSVTEEWCFAESPDCLSLSMVMKKCQWKLIGRVCMYMDVVVQGWWGGNAARLNFYIWSHLEITCVLQALLPNSSPAIEIGLHMVSLL